MLRYCNPKEVNQKRKDFLKQKTTFLSQLQLLRENGKNLQLMKKVEIWLDENIEYLYQQSETGKMDKY